MTDPRNPNNAPRQIDGEYFEEPTQDQLVEQIEQIQDSELNETGPNATLRRHIEIFSRPTPLLKGLGHTILGASIIPLAIAFIAFSLSPNYETSGFVGAATRSLWMLCGPLFVALCLARCVRSGGIAEKHFRWSRTLCDGLSKTLNMIIWTWLPLRFVYTSLETFDAGRWNNSLGRILFIGAMIAMTFGLWLTSKSISRWLKEDETDSRIHPIRHLLLWFLPMMPATLAVMSAFGFHFTAVQISWRALWTILLMTGIGMLGGLISRLLLIAQFGIKLRQLNRNDDGEIHNDESIDIGGISKQVNRLLRATALVAMVVVGWQIWANVLPIFGYLDSWHLYESTTNGLTKWVTVRHLLMSAGILFITFVLSHNLPGLLEITLLDRLPLDRGGRYAISFIVKYVVGIVGILAACQIIGFSWSKVQWLAAGLTVGLGFGLQEIFANIVSGIIILIERPIRVGDVVTVNGTTGTVTRMQLRATTVMDRDYRELIVPNKKFITEDVMNWTLTDLTSRVVFKVGVAYGSDTQLVHDTLLKVARRHPLINEVPSAEVVFESFGDSTLNFELRVFIPNREVYAQVLHELNMGINEAFGNKEIEIAFPQQDIYIKNLNELPTTGPNSGRPGGRSPLANAPMAQTRNSQTKGRGGSTSALANPGLANPGLANSRQGKPIASAQQRHSNQLAENASSNGVGDRQTNRSVENHESDDKTLPPQGKRKVIPFPLRKVRGDKDAIIAPKPKRRAG